MWHILLLLVSVVSALPTDSFLTSVTPIIIYDSALGGPCSSNTNCQGLVANAICSNGICVCRSGYHPEGPLHCAAGDGTTTTPSTSVTPELIYDSALGGPCSSNTNCQGLVANAICSNGICVCEPGYHPEGPLHCAGGDGTTTTPSTSVTPELIYDSALGGPCSSNTNCQGLINNAHCLDGVCTCLPGYHAAGLISCVEGENNLSSTTIPQAGSTTTAVVADRELGSSCTSKADCQNFIRRSTCRNGKCACQTGFIARGKKKCLCKRIALNR